MNYNLDAVPPGFKILSERPELEIKYRYRSPFVDMIFLLEKIIDYFLVMDKQKLIG